MKVSIIIPVYNVANYIIRCIDSVVKQTYRNIECILVDDCGQDNSIQLAEQYAKGYTGDINFKIIHHNINEGVATARNTGIMAATGTFLFFLDSDDTITPDCISKLINLHIKYPNIDFAQGNAISKDGEISTYGCHYIIDEYIDNKEELYRHLLSLQTTVPWNRLIKRKFVLENSIFFPDGKVWEDMFWIYFVAKYANAAAFTNDGTYVYYTNENSFMTIKTTRSQQLHRLYSRISEAYIYFDDLNRVSQTSKYQRQYLAVNLLSCLTELHLLRSFSKWCNYWYKISFMSVKIISKITFHRVAFYICLMPPICFIANRNNIRWRIQKYIISFL